MDRWCQRIVATIGVLMMVACGGGGGGGGGGSGGAGPTPLLPTAPALGPTLYASASTLRPLRNGATWNYRGTYTAGPGVAPVAYETSTTHSSASTSGAEEAGTNSANVGPTTQKVVVSGGVVSSPGSIDFAGKGVEQAFDAIELRSPVRKDDQYAILDKRYPDTAIDVDRDGKADALEVAIYARVIGNETLALPNLPTIKALRVDTFVLERVTASSDGKFIQIVSLDLRTWYAEGVGVVKQTAVQPTASGNGFSTTDEQLSSWDGVTTGFGVMAQTPAIIPVSNGVFPGGILPTGRRNFAAFAFSDHALVFTDPPTGDLSGTMISRIDLRGAIQSATLDPEFGIAGCKVLVANDAEVMCLAPAASGSPVDYVLKRRDSDGRVVGPVGGASINLAGNRNVLSGDNRVVGAVDGTTLWLFWDRVFFDPAAGGIAGELILQPYSLDGIALAPEIFVDRNGNIVSVSAHDGQATISWCPPNNWIVATATPAGTALARALVTNLVPSSVSVSNLLAGGRDVFAWSIEPGTQNVGIGGIVLDAPLTPRQAGATLKDDLIGGMPAYDTFTPTIAAFGSLLSVTTYQTQAKLWPSDSSTSSVWSVNWLDVGTGPLATMPVSSVRWAANVAPNDRDGQLLLADRLLVFERRQNSFGLGTTVVWLNKGPSP